MSQELEFLVEPQRSHGRFKSCVSQPESSRLVELNCTNNRQFKIFLLSAFLHSTERLNCMYALSDTAFELEAEPIFRKVFVRGGLEEIFSPDIAVRQVIYPCWNFDEDGLPIRAIISAALELGDTGCYFALGYPPIGEPVGCYVPLSELQEGYNGEPDSDNLIGVKLDVYPHQINTMIFSASGQWGAFSCEGGLGFLGGNAIFFDRIRSFVPDLDRQVYSYLADLQEDKLAGYRLTLEWLPGLLTHFYGNELAQQMLTDYQLP